MGRLISDQNAPGRVRRSADEHPDEDEEPVVPDEDGGVGGDHVDDADDEQRATSSESVAWNSSD